MKYILWAAVVAVAMAGTAARCQEPARPESAVNLIGSWTNGHGAVYTFLANDIVEVRVKDRRFMGQYLFQRGTVAISYPGYGLMEVAQISPSETGAAAQLRSTILVTSVRGSKPGDEHVLTRRMERVADGE